MILCSTRIPMCLLNAGFILLIPRIIKIFMKYSRFDLILCFVKKFKQFLCKLCTFSNERKNENNQYIRLEKHEKLYRPINWRTMHSIEARTFKVYQMINGPNSRRGYSDKIPSPNAPLKFFQICTSVFIRNAVYSFVPQ